MATRYLIITDSDKQRRAFSYADTRPDSEALHDVLTNTDPGDDYSVRFSNHRPRGICAWAIVPLYRP